MRYKDNKATKTNVTYKIYLKARRNHTKVTVNTNTSKEEPNKTHLLTTVLVISDGFAERTNAFQVCDRVLCNVHDYKPRQLLPSTLTHSIATYHIVVRTIRNVLIDRRCQLVVTPEKLQKHIKKSRNSSQQRERHVVMIFTFKTNHTHTQRSAV